MQHSAIGSLRVSRFGVGTKRMPTTDASRVVRIDPERSHGIVQSAVEQGVNYISTSYSDRKGEAESFLGEELAQQPNKVFAATSYFDMVDPRYEYVFQKQMKKLGANCIDFYYVEGVCDLTRMRGVDSGAVDFLFEQKNAGRIAKLGFSSELNPDNLRDYLKRYPWDFVRLRLNYYDWYMKGARERYAVATELHTPIVAHGALRVGPCDYLKPAARALLSEASPERSTIDWALRFVKTLGNVRVVTCNVGSTEQLLEDVAVFQDDVVLDDSEMQLLAQAAQQQRSLLHSK